MIQQGYVTRVVKELFHGGEELILNSSMTDTKSKVENLIFSIITVIGGQLT